MQLSARHLLMQFAHLLQQDLFGPIESVIDPFSESLKLVVATVAMAPLQPLLSAMRAHTGRPAKDRTALATAFIAKAVLHLPTTRHLIARLKVDEGLRQLCGWNSVGAVPHESKFSRAFAEFAHSELPQRLHSALIELTQKQRLVGHIARDSTAIEAREKPAEKRKKPSKTKPQKGKRRKSAHARQKASQRGTRIQRQRKQTLATMLSDLPRQCDIGVKKSRQGHEQVWCGYKLHLDVADGQIPVSAILTSASVHDSQVAIPLMTMTGQRVTHLYEVMDSAYDADDILEHSRTLNHVPIVQPHARRGTRKPSQLPKIFPVIAAPQLTPAQQERYKQRTMAERVNSRLKDEFGATQVRVRGAAKVMAHLMFGVLVLSVDQWLRMATPG